MMDSSLSSSDFLQSSTSIVLTSDSDDSEEYHPVNQASLSFMTPQRRKSVIPETDSEEDVVSISSDDSDIINASQSSSNLDKNHSIVNTKKKNVPMTPRAKNNLFRPQQPTLDKFIRTLPFKDAGVEVHEEKKVQIKCKRTEYNEQISLIATLQKEMMKSKNYMSTIKLANLPDKGKLLKDRFELHKTKFLAAQERLRNMVVTEEDLPTEETTGRALATKNWTNIEAGIAAVQPKTFGKKGLENHNIQKALTAECLEQLHGSLKNCPSEDQRAEDPNGLKVNLMDHQKSALSWLIFRETQKPAGGILADDMGLGKTLTMIALILKTKSDTNDREDEKNRKSPSKDHKKYNGGTLIVCPASLLNQWSGEIDSKLKRGRLSYNIYHGPKRDVKAKRLAEHDVVITTYSIVMHELEKNGAIFRVRWNRIILDEAHQIRNHKAVTSVACCDLSAKYRWALTGTPVHNKELDMYALLKFLRCTPFDDLGVWKRWVSDKNSGGGERLNAVISSLMLRRTKDELMSQGKLVSLPSRTWKLVPVTLDQSEMAVYSKILLFSQTLFAQFLHQRAEKNQDYMEMNNPGGDPNGEYFKMRKKLLRMNRMRDISQHEILVLLLRLRQICCHLSLVTKMLQGDEDLGEGEVEESEELNLLEQLNKLDLDDEGTDVAAGISDEGLGLKEATKGLWNPSNPVFAKDRMSSKVKTLMDMIPAILSSGDKIVIVSQWKTYLELVGIHLKRAEIGFSQLDGSVPTAKRMEMVTTFNDNRSSIKVLLLSLTAGGVGLNLVGGNHLFLLDLHWNPQLENQAQDRIYRMGQKKKVFVYKFMASDTIEERIKQLQENKVAIAESMLTGSKQVIGNKLSLNDLKMLFNM